MTASKMTVNGVSVCATGQENYEHFEARRGKWFYQYDYRHTDGELFSIVLPTLEMCRMERDKWLLAKTVRKSERQEIRQNGLPIVWSNDGISMSIMFRNLTDLNFTDTEEYTEYVQKMVTQLAFQYGDIELIADNATILTGQIRKTL